MKVQGKARRRAALGGFILIVLILVGDFLTGAIGTRPPDVDAGFNFVKGVGVNTSDILPLGVGNFNCTGVSTPGITAVSNQALQISGQYAGIDRNQTAWYQWVFVTIGTAQPTTTFSSGSCSLTQSLREQSFMYFPVASATNIVTVAFSFTFTPTAGTTYFAWIDIEQRGVVAGHIDYHSQGISGGSSLTVLELK